MKVRERGNPALHLLDRYAGVPAVAALGALKRQRLLPAPIEHIGLLKTAGIGDTVLLSAVLADLRQAFPRAYVVFFCSQSNFEIAGMLKGIDRIVEVPIVNITAGLRTIRAPSIDVLLDFGHWSRTEALLARLSRAKFTVGFRTRGQHRHYAYDLTVKHSARIHELENYRRLVRAIGVETGSRPTLRAPASGGAPKRDYAVLHLWSAGRRRELKQWPLANWMRLAADLGKWDLDLVLTGGPSDRPRNDEVIAALAPDVRRRAKNAAGVSLAESCAILAHARLVVSVDTGVMHLAAALGTSLVSLHGPTSSRRWGPVSDTAIAIDSPLPGSGYIHLGWENMPGPPKCMEAITCDMVREACLAALEDGTAARAAQPTDDAVRN